MVKRKIVAVMSTKGQKYRLRAKDQTNSPDIVDSDTCGSARSGSTSLDNRFAVAHTLHNATTAILGTETRKEVKTTGYNWGKIIVVRGEK